MGTRRPASVGAVPAGGGERGVGGDGEGGAAKVGAIPGDTVQGGSTFVLCHREDSHGAVAKAHRVGGTHFPHFPLLVFKVFFFSTTMFLIFQGGSPMINGFSIVSRGAYRALCAHCAKSRPFSTTGRQFFGCRIAARYYHHCVSLQHQPYPFLRVCTLANGHSEAGIW